MTRTIEAISGVLYPLIITGMLLGFGWAGLQWLTEATGEVATWIPSPIALGAAVFTLLLAGWLAERLVPFAAMAQERWIYRERPRRRLRGLDRDSAIQVLFFLLGGLILGSAAGHPGELAAVGIVARLLPALRSHRRLPQLLRAGSTRLIGTSPWAVQDSEMVSEALAANWLSRHPMPSSAPTASLSRLFLRRVRRRSYLLIIGVVVIGAAVALAGPMAKTGVLCFLLAWGILGAGLFRCANFARLGVSSRLGLVVLAVHGLIALAAVWLIWGLSNPGWGAPMTVAAVITVGYRRGLPRQATNPVSVDSGFGVSMSPELINYYLRGIILGGVLAGTVAFLGV